MRISILLTLIIVVCAVCLIVLLYPRETTAKAKRVLPKRKPLPSPTPEHVENQNIRPAGKTQKTMSEMEAIRNAVRTFVDEDPSTTARILKSWMKK
jgi:flagellar biosynthesis/type III secretory pathway M-ring protein FliF/YscJ